MSSAPWYEEGPRHAEPLADEYPDLRETRLVTRGQGGRTAQRSELGAMLEAAGQLPPRDPKAMLAEARRVGEMMGARAFYRWGTKGRGGRKSTVEGPSIELAYALAQVWGRCVTRVRVAEEDGSRVTLTGVYVDLATMAITERDFVAHLADPPGRFASQPDQAERWRVMQLQSAASKAVRGAILGGLPGWYVDAAFQAATRADAAQATGGKSLPEARRACVDFLATLGLTQTDLEAYVDLPMDLWAAADLAELRDLARRLRSGELAVEAVKAEVTAQAPARPAPAPQAPESAPADRAAALGLGARREAPDPQLDPDGPTKDDLLSMIEQGEAAVGAELARRARLRAGVPAEAKLTRRFARATLDGLLTELEREADALSAGEE